MLELVRKLIGSFSVKYVLFIIILLLVVTVALMYREHNNDIKKLNQQSSIIKTQDKTITELKKDFDIAEKVNAKAAMEKNKIREEKSHEAKVINRYFKIYKNDCSTSAMPRSIVKRLRQDTANTNKNNQTPSPSASTVGN